MKKLLLFLCVVFVFINIWRWSLTFKHSPSYEIEAFPYLRQSDGITCGPTSVAMVLRKYGKDVSIAEVEKYTNTHWLTYKGRPLGMTSPEYIPIALSHFGVPSDRMEGTLDRLKYFVNHRRPPVVLVRSGKMTWHYIVVIGYTSDLIIIADPADGARHEIPVKDFLGAWDFFSDLWGESQQGMVQLLRTAEVYPRTMVVPSIDIEGTSVQEVSMFFLLAWIFFGLIVGLLAKALYPGEDAQGFLPTVGIGVAGSFVGGGLRWLLNMGGTFHPAGLLWSVIGGVIFCWFYRRYKLGQFLKAQGRMPRYTQFRKE